MAEEPSSGESAKAGEPEPSEGALVTLPPAAEEVIRDLPPQQARILRASFTALYQGPSPNPLMAKMTGAHIDRLIGIDEKALDYEAADRKDARRFGSVVGLVVAALAVLVVLILALNGHADLVSQLIPLALAFAGGFGGGYGWAKRRP
jgi:hypothetical protein